MEALFRDFTVHITLALEVLSVLMIAIGAVVAVWQLLRSLVRRRATHGALRAAWLGLARWLLLGLEFMLAADIIRSLIAPSWDDIGQLASIALIRTFLNYFLEQDLEKAARQSEPAPLSDREVP